MAKPQVALARPEEIIWPDLPICDAHHHLWDVPDSRYLLPELLADIAQGHRIESTVFIECMAFYSAHRPGSARFVGETEFAAGVAAMAESGRYGPVRVCAGIVGRADLTEGAAVGEALEAHVRAAGGRFRAVRHAAGWDPSPEIRRSHSAPSPDLYDRPDFREGFARLAQHGLAFESWQYHPQLPQLAALARAYPDVPIILDHVGGPLGVGPYAGRRDEVFAGWKAGILDLACCPNVVVKLGGLGMTLCGFGFERAAAPASSEALAEAWRPYIETCIEAFGVERAMFESNFPVDRASCSYPVLWNALKRTASGASADEKAKLFRDNAVKVYRLDV